MLGVRRSSDPYALDRMSALKNIELKRYHVDDAGVGFHTKGYLLKHQAAKWLTKTELDSVEWLPEDITLIQEIRKKL